MSGAALARRVAVAARRSRPRWELAGSRGEELAALDAGAARRLSGGPRASARPARRCGFGSRERLARAGLGGAASRSRPCWRAKAGAAPRWAASSPRSRAPAAPGRLAIAGRPRRCRRPGSSPPTRCSSEPRGAAARALVAALCPTRSTCSPSAPPPAAARPPCSPRSRARRGGPLAAELARRGRRDRVRRAAREALAALRARVPGASSATLVAAIERSRRYGSPLAEQLREQAAALRARGRAPDRGARRPRRAQDPARRRAPPRALGAADDRRGADRPRRRALRRRLVSRAVARRRLGPDDSAAGGIDLGGTKIQAAIVDAAGRSSGEPAGRPRPRAGRGRRRGDGGGPARGGGSAGTRAARLDGVGVGSPGDVDAQTGTVSERPQPPRLDGALPARATRSRGARRAGQDRQRRRGRDRGGVRRSAPASRTRRCSASSGARASAAACPRRQALARPRRGRRDRPHGRQARRRHVPVRAPAAAWRPTPAAAAMEAEARREHEEGAQDRPLRDHGGARPRPAHERRLGARARATATRSPSELIERASRRSAPASPPR